MGENTANQQGHKKVRAFVSFDTFENGTWQEYITGQILQKLPSKHLITLHGFKTLNLFLWFAMDQNLQTIWKYLARFIEYTDIQQMFRIQPDRDETCIESLWK